MQKYVEKDTDDATCMHTLYDFYVPWLFIHITWMIAEMQTKVGNRCPTLMLHIVATNKCLCIVRLFILLTMCMTHQLIYHNNISICSDFGKGCYTLYVQRELVCMLDYTTITTCNIWNTGSVQNTALVSTPQTFVFRTESSWDDEIHQENMLEKFSNTVQPFYKFSHCKCLANTWFVDLGLGIYQALGIALFS